MGYSAIRVWRCAPKSRMTEISAAQTSRVVGITPPTIAQHGQQGTLGAQNIKTPLRENRIVMA